MGNRTRLVRLIVWFSLGCWASAAQAQFYFEADSVFLGRTNQGGASVVAGPQPVDTKNGNYSVEPGYRLSIGTIFDNFQVDTSFTQLSPWEASGSGSFLAPVDFDGPRPGNNTLNFNGFLRAAALDTFNGEDTESEQIRASNWTSYSSSSYLDAEINFGSSQVNRRWRLAGGYRYIQLDEKNGVSMFGTFDAPDVGGGVIQPNNGLSHDALTDAGASLISGVADGFNSGGTDQLQYSVNSNANNRMSGFQTTFGYRFYDGDWFTLEGISKAGIYANSISGQVQETVVGSGLDNSVYQRTLRDKEIAAAFAGNLGLRAVVGITDYIDLVAGWEVLFLAGLALGPDQINGLKVNNVGTTVYQVDNHGSMVATGGTLGIRIYW
ncbi:hypothetical protein [Planctomicrobium piriforme]|uniref:Uncharacterized protein n=1 Tax=Planctomicrobium piriforme TaxID=1576369 RepID=A0A1I3E2T1_9PLAN|nr:hypothetical protein [Planctomicrobium piriforme]SFH93284.1 hypothetical protein SAMN05421753_10456 [Planctomicrobium piriforme]